jgi:hypothetical protein
MKKKLFTVLILLITFVIGNTIQAEEVVSNLTSPLEGKTFEIDWIVKSVTDDNGNKKTIRYYESFDNKVYDSEGKEVVGNYTYGGDYDHFTYGYNFISYTFHPMLPQYKSFSGNFIVNYTKEPNVKAYKNKINVLVQTSVFKILVNGKEYKKTTISNLKPSTKYKVEIYKRANENMEETLIYSKTIKTKAK